jgi:hypothetical protein
MHPFPNVEEGMETHNLLIPQKEVTSIMAVKLKFKYKRIKLLRMPSSGMLRRVVRLLVTVNVVPSSPIIFTLMMEALRSSETSVPTGATRRIIRGDGILHSHRRENLKILHRINRLDHVAET